MRFNLKTESKWAASLCHLLAPARVLASVVFWGAIVGASQAASNNQSTGLKLIATQGPKFNKTSNITTHKPKKSGVKASQLPTASASSNAICLDESAGGAGCGSQDEDVYFSQSFTWLVQEPNERDPERLETVVVIAKKGCYVWVTGSSGQETQVSCDGLTFIDGYTGLAGVSVGTVKDVVETSVEIAAPMLQLCAKISPTRNTTPDKDKGRAYYDAKEALAYAYAGNWGELRVGQRFDAYYPLTGSVIALIIDSPVSIIDGKLSITVERLPYEAPRSTSPCKP